MTLYQITRNAYHAVWHREVHHERRQRRDFYAEFVPAQGSLAFDVGAFRGDVTDALVRAGARVVAVEPNPRLARHLKRQFGSTVVIEEAAVGDTPGAAELRVGHYEGHSTLSADWIDRTGPERWASSVTVPVTTLDDLIARHGLPEFVKIDVEAYEAHVVRGLSTPVRALSFEFQCGSPAVLDEVLGLLGRLATYEFNFTLVDLCEFASDWTDEEGLRMRIASACAGHDDLYGDVFARLRP